MRLVATVLLALAPLVCLGAEKAKAETTASEPKKLTPGTYARLKTPKGEILIHLLADEAPKTVENFVELAKGLRPWRNKDDRWVAKPFYDGLSFYRIEKDDLIGSGCPKDDGTGGPGYRLADEITGELKFDKPGVVAMETFAGREASGSRFFITLARKPPFNGRFSIFGQVVRGLDVARTISQMPAVKSKARPKAVHLAKQPVVIQSVTIEEVTMGVKAKARDER